MIGSVGVIASSGSAYDINVRMFFMAGNITNPTIKTAINTYVLDLKSNNLWSLFVCLHPFVGGTALSSSINLIDTSLFTVVFNGGWTYPNGALPNGTNGYYDTGVYPNLVLTESDYSYGFYYGTTTVLNQYTGIYDAGGALGMFKASTSLYVYGNTTADIAPPITPSSFDGFHQVTKHNATEVKYKHSGEAIETRGCVPTLPMATSMFTYGGDLALYEDREIFLDYFTNRALTNAEMATLETLTEQLQTNLGR